MYWAVLPRCLKTWIDNGFFCTHTVFWQNASVDFEKLLDVDWIDVELLNSADLEAGLLYACDNLSGQTGLNRVGFDDAAGAVF